MVTYLTNDRIASKSPEEARRGIKDMGRVVVEIRAYRIHLLVSAGAAAMLLVSSAQAQA